MVQRNDKGVLIIFPSFSPHMFKGSPIALEIRRIFITNGAEVHLSVFRSDEREIDEHSEFKAKCC